MISVMRKVEFAVADYIFNVSTLSIQLDVHSIL